MEGGKKHPNRLVILALNTMFTEGTDEVSQAQRASVTQQLWLARGRNATSSLPPGTTLSLLDFLSYLLVAAV